MAYNDISKNFTYENGGTIDGDLALTTMAANTKIKNKSSGELYAKRSGFTNVFDKSNTLADYLKADEFGINTSGSGNGVASITYSSSGRKITQNLTTFTTPSDLATANDNLKSQAVGSISVSGRTVTYKNVNGQTLGSFQTQDNNTTYSAGSGLSSSGTTFNVTSTAGNSNLQWNTEVTLGTVGGFAIKARMPALTSSDIINALGYTPAREGSGGVSYGPERIVYTSDSSITENQLVSGNRLYGNAGNDSTYMSDQLSGTWKITIGLSYHHTYSYEYETEGHSGQDSLTATVTIYQCYAKQFLG